MTNIYQEMVGVFLGNQMRIVSMTEWGSNFNRLARQLKQR
jgi:hypothetical protein